MSTILVSHARIQGKEGEKISEVWKAIVSGAKKVETDLAILAPTSYHNHKEFISLIKEAVEKQPDVLILPFTPTEPNLVEEMVKILQQFKGKIVAINVPPTPEIKKKLPNIIGYVGPNEEETGILAAEMLLRRFRLKKIVITMHEKGHYGHELRIKGIEKNAKKHGVEIVKVYVGAENQEIDDLEEALDDGTAIIALGIRGVEAALRAVSKTKLSMPIIGMDLNPEICSKIEENEVMATIIQHPEKEGELAVKLANEAAKRDFLYAEISCGPTGVTKNNVRIFI